MNALLRITLIIAAATSLSACTPQPAGSSSPAAKQATAADAKASYVILYNTPYFKNGPAQPMPADGTFRAGTHVSKLNKIGNFTLVRAADGTQGYVDTADIKLVGQ